MKSKIYEFDPVIYPFPLLVTRDYDERELGDLFYCLTEDDEVKEDYESFRPNPNTIARTIFVVSRETNMRYVIIMLVRPKGCGVGTIAHEAGHYANMIADICGFLPGHNESDEPLQYLTQWAANCIDCVKRGHVEWMKGTVYGNDDTDTTESVQ